MNLSNYMRGVYMWMCISLLISAVTSWLVSSDAAINILFFQPHGLTLLGWVTIISPLAIIMLMGFLGSRISLGLMQGLLVLFSAVYGISLSVLVAHYTSASIFATFVVTAGAFAGLSLYGAITKRNLGVFGTFLMVLLVGIIIASMINIFVHSAHLNMVITLLGLVVYGGLTAFDTQKIRADFTQYSPTLSDTDLAKMTIMSAMKLYIDFIGMFQNLLELVGQERN